MIGMRISIEVIHLLRRLVEEYMERKRDLHLVFINLDRAYNKVWRLEVYLWLILN